MVLGDAMLDVYTSGSVERVSPEAPIPVVNVRSKTEILGGACNAASNARVLGAKVMYAGVTGKDGAGLQIVDLLKEQKIQTKVVKDASRPTTLKNRIVAGSGQQIVRVDSESCEPISRQTEEKLLQSLDEALEKVDAVLVSDYAKGVCTKRVVSQVLKCAKKLKIPVIVDPKPSGQLDLQILSAASAITPNAREAKEILGSFNASVEQVGKSLSKELGGSLVLTRGGDGMDVYQEGKRTVHYDSESPEVVDVSGAGDTVAVIVALALAAGSTVEEAAHLATYGAAVVVAKNGTATVSVSEIDALL